MKIWKTTIALPLLLGIVAASVSGIILLEAGGHTFLYEAQNYSTPKIDIDLNKFYWIGSGVLIEGVESEVPNNAVHYLNFSAGDEISNYSAWIGSITGDAGCYDSVKMKIENELGDLIELPESGDKKILCLNCDMNQSYYAGFKYYNTNFSECFIDTQASA